MLTKTINQNIPIFIINLACDLDKKIRMQTLCEEHHLHYEFIEGVDGKKITNKEIVSIYKQKENFRPLAKEEIGCALSHIKVYKKILNN